ncbi:MAG: lipocalin-like domain-containing protein [Geminicoccaceae bacterium]
MSKRERLFGCITALLLLVLLPGSGLADDVEARLYGSWRLVSFKIVVDGDQAAAGEAFGDHPFGRLILTPQHTMAAYLSRSDRKPPTSHAEEAALLSSMIAYTGKFRVEGDEFITTVDGAWDETFKAHEQVRHFTLEGDRLNIQTDEWTTGWLHRKRQFGILVWERE